MVLVHQANARLIGLQRLSAFTFHHVHNKRFCSKIDSSINVASAVDDQRSPGEERASNVDDDQDNAKSPWSADIEPKVSKRGINKSRFRQREFF